MFIGLYAQLYNGIQREDEAQIRQLLSSGGEVDFFIRKQGGTLLHHAALTTGSTLLPLFLEHVKTAANVNKLLSKRHKNFFNATVLHIAAHQSHGTIVDKVLEIAEHNPALLNKKDDFNRTPLHIAASMGGRYHVMALLKIPSVDKNAQDDNGWTFLHRIASRSIRDGGENFRHILRDSHLPEATINFKDHHGRTALHAAALHGNKTAIIELIRYGADLTLCDNNNDTAQNCADKASQTEASRLLDFLTKKNEISEQWTLERPEFDSFLQWLPREMVEDTLALSVEKELLDFMYNYDAEPVSQ